MTDSKKHATWTVEPGKALVRDDQEIASVTCYEGKGRLAPYYVDCLTKRIAALLTEHGDGLDEAREALRRDD